MHWKYSWESSEKWQHHDIIDLTNPSVLDIQIPFLEIQHKCGKQSHQWDSFWTQGTTILLRKVVKEGCDLLELSSKQMICKTAALSSSALSFQSRFVLPCREELGSCVQWSSNHTVHLKNFCLHIAFSFGWGLKRLFWSHNSNFCIQNTSVYIPHSAFPQVQ